MKLELTPVGLIVLAALAVVLTKGVPPEGVALALLMAFTWYSTGGGLRPG